MNIKRCFRKFVGYNYDNLSAQYGVYFRKIYLLLEDRLYNNLDNIKYLEVI